MDYCPFDIVPAPEALNLRTHHVETRYGRLALRTSPERRSGTATLYIHGVGADWTTWTPLIRAEAASGLDVHDQVFVDLPGFGGSENRLDRLDIADVGTAILDAAASLGYSRFSIVGHSMGGFLTLDIASRNPGRVDSIHLVAGPYFSILTSIQHPILSFGHDARVAAIFGTQYLLAHTREAEVALLRALYRLGLFRLFLVPFVSHPFALKESVVRALSEQANPRGLLLTAANGENYSADDQWAKIRCPIRAVFGEQDRLVPRTDLDRLLRCQPTAECVTIPDAGHLMHIERPLPVLAALALWS